MDDTDEPASTTTVELTTNGDDNADDVNDEVDSKASDGGSDDEDDESAVAVGPGRPARRKSLIMLKQMVKKNYVKFFPRGGLPKHGPNSSFSLVMRSGFAEFVAAAIYCYIGIGATVASLRNDESGGTFKLQSAIAHGFAVYVLSHATGHLSGGHFGNPVVSLAMTFSRRLSLAEFGVYFFSQLTGSLLGGALAYGARYRASYDAADGMNHGPFVAACTTEIKFNNPDGTAWRPSAVTEGGLFLSETMACMIICLVVLACCDPATQLSPTSGPHAIGMTVVAVHLASDYTVAANFLRSFSAAIIANDKDCWEGHWVFWVAGIFGALLAVFVYGTFGLLARVGHKKVAPKAE